MGFIVDDFDFDLPQELIAQVPLPQRSASRLLHVDAINLVDHCFCDLPRLLNEGDLMVFNDVKVIKARFLGCKESGGQIEVLLERVLNQRTAIAQIRASKAPRPGSRLQLAGAFEVTVNAREGEFFILQCQNEGDDWWLLAERYGRLPLPPYIQREAAQNDEQRYQTVFARTPGAIAAPTAGLHFDEPLLQRLAEIGVGTAHLTLFVGAGTFQPVRVAKLADHVMHRERYEIPAETVAAIATARQRQRQVIAVGTTTLRALEAAALQANGTLPRMGLGETDIFITPGFGFQVVDRLVTNFHLPRSTLLMLVAAFAGIDVIKRAYAHAIAGRYRFFSYGDAMLLDAASRCLIQKEASHGV